MERSKAAIVSELDAIEVEIFGLYKRLERLRLDLQQQWRVRPSDAIEAAPRRSPEGVTER